MVAIDILAVLLHLHKNCYLLFMLVSKQMPFPFPTRQQIESQKN